jgi:hypothetical protein
MQWCSALLRQTSLKLYLGVDSDDMKTMCILLNAVNAHMFRQVGSLFESPMGGPSSLKPVIAMCDNCGTVAHSH